MLRKILLAVAAHAPNRRQHNHVLQKYQNNVAPISLYQSHLGNYVRDERPYLRL